MSGLDEAGLAAARKAIIGNPLNDDQLTRIITAYLASTSPGEGGEPVAWCWRHTTQEGYRFVAFDRPDPNDPHLIAEPLYTASPDREKIIEALRPFANAPDDPFKPPEQDIDGSAAARSLTFADLRGAQDALSSRGK